MSKIYEIRFVTREKWRAKAYVKRYVMLRPFWTDVYRRVDTLDGSEIISLNPDMGGYRAVCRSAAATWLKRDVNGRVEYCDGNDDDDIRDRNCKMRILDIIESLVLQHWGFSGYVQNRLPF